MIAPAAGMTLTEALASGQGIERPFRCEAHNDTHASASVNVVKMVWYCYACHESGGVDKKKKAPEIDALLELMISPDRIGRIYPEAYLRLYDNPGYWLGRFPAWLCSEMGLGEDPFTGDGIFPVHTGEGRLAGVGRRHLFAEEVGEAKIKVEGTRYLYPKAWSASQTLFGTRGRWTTHPVIIMVEGAADATAIWEVGAPGFAVYGSGVHLPQVDLVYRMAPKLILLGFDMDEAGEKAVSRAFGDLSRIAPVARVRWPRARKDPAATPYATRKEILHRAVADAGYGDVVPQWTAWRRDAQLRYDHHLEGAR
jgi:hypothetical protein